VPVVLVVTIAGLVSLRSTQLNWTIGSLSLRKHSLGVVATDLLSCTAVGLQPEDVWAGARLEVEGRHYLAKYRRRVSTKAFNLVSSPASTNV
jgi:hypothetical protein